MKRIAQTGDALARMAADSQLQDEICSALEILADGLPGSLDTDLACRLPAVLSASWTEHVSLQEKVIVPILKRHNANSPAVNQQIEQLVLEHGMIADLGHEITEQFELALEGAEPNSGMFGYMLRCAFQDRRRHLAWERRLFDELLPIIFTPADRALFDTWLDHHGWPRFLMNSSEF